MEQKKPRWEPQKHDKKIDYLQDLQEKVYVSGKEGKLERVVASPEDVLAMDREKILDMLHCLASFGFGDDTVWEVIDSIERKVCEGGS